MYSRKDFGYLTVGDDSSYTQDGGVLRFYVKDDKISIEINTKAAKKHKLQISSRLLALARLVEY